MRYHSVTWQDENFDRSAIVLSFNSKKARAAFGPQCRQRFEPIDSKKKAALLRDSRLHRLVLWDESEPLRFVFA